MDEAEINRGKEFRKMWDATNNGDFGPCNAWWATAQPYHAERPLPDDGPNPGEFEIDWSAINRDFSA